MRRIVNHWPEEEAKIAVITDGERILGLGDLGSNGLGISIGDGLYHSQQRAVCSNFSPELVNCMHVFGLVFVNMAV